MRVCAGSILLLFAACFIDVPDEDRSGVFGCASVDDCLAGFRCVDGLCVRGAGDAPGGDSGPECSDHPDCDDDNVCTSDACEAGTCTHDSLAGQSCTTGTITSGECVDIGLAPECRLADGEPCTDGDECASGLCNGNICAG